VLLIVADSDSDSTGGDVVVNDRFVVDGAYITSAAEEEEVEVEAL